MHSLRELLIEQMRDLYDAELQFGGLLPDMIDKATSHDLTEALIQIAEDGRENIQQIEEVCELFSALPSGVTCEAMRGLVREAKCTTSVEGETATIDAGLIANAQRIAHYEIAGFGTARAFAQCLGESRAAQILAELTDRAGGHDKALTQIATGGWFFTGVNKEAALADS